MTATETIATPLHSNGDTVNTDVFEAFSAGLTNKGYCIFPNALPLSLTQALYHQVQTAELAFAQAGIGRGKDNAQNRFIRSDESCWIEGNTEAERLWLEWTGQLRLYLNRQLFLGLQSFESHFSLYRRGTFYRQHLDAFKGEANRMVSVVAYLNPGWEAADGGQLTLYDPANQDPLIQVTPAFGTVVIFLSEEFPHEVLPSWRDRYSIAGWYRVNNSARSPINPSR